MIISQHLILSGDVELNPGPLNAEIEAILSTADDTVLDEDDWNAVVIECSPLASRWQSLCAYLGLQISLLDQIKRDYSSDSQGCLNEALKQWIRRNYNHDKFGAPSWRTLLRAIALVDKSHFMRLAGSHQAVKSSSAIEIEAACASREPVDQYVNPKDLYLIKWKDDQGTTRRFYLLDKISKQWRDLGLLLGLPMSRLACLATEHQQRHTECCRAVFGLWLDAPPTEYPPTWKGLMELLEDCQLDELVSELKTVLVKANML